MAILFWFKTEVKGVILYQTSVGSLLLDNIVCVWVVVEETMPAESHDSRRLTTLLDHHLTTLNLLCYVFSQFTYLIVVRVLYYLRYWYVYTASKPDTC